MTKVDNSLMKMLSLHLIKSNQQGLRIERVVLKLP